MKTIKIFRKSRWYVAIALLLLLGGGCNDFDEMNKNPTKLTSIDPNSQLGYAQLLIFGDTRISTMGHEYCASFVQHFMGAWESSNFGGQFRKDNERTNNYWSRIYSLALNNLVDIIDSNQDNPLHHNVCVVANIMRIYYSALLTDLYGDVPYFEACKGFSEGIVKPDYDLQELIYKDFLKELKLAESSLTNDGGKISGDIIYNGDIEKWKRFANTLRFRLAMRLVKVEPALALSEVNDIMNSASGIFASSADDAVIQYMDILDFSETEFRRNGLSQMRRRSNEYPEGYLCSTFWDYLRDSDDPRLFRLGRAYYKQLSPNNPFGRIDLTEEILSQETGIALFQPCLPGFDWWANWPNGYWSNTLNDWIDAPCRPEVNNIFIRNDAPGIILSYAESQLLLSEAKVRWGNNVTIGQDVASYYENGVRAAMNLLNDNYAFANSDKISNDEIDDFLVTQPLPADNEGRIRLINEQLWILHFNNPLEAYANWRRTDYPVLKSPREYGAVTHDSQEIPRRMFYPALEEFYNKEAYQAAVDRLGGSDSWNVRVWWDKEL